MIDILLVILTALQTVTVCGMIVFYKYFLIIKARFEAVSDILDKKVKLVNEFDVRLKNTENQITVIRLGKK